MSKKQKEEEGGASPPETAARPTWQIYAEDETYNGSHPGGVRFINGLAKTEDAALAKDFASRGFKVIPAVE